MTARLGLVRLLITYAWQGRGSDYSKGVREEQWKLFGDRLRAASGYLEGLDPKDDPVIYIEYYALAETLLASREALDKIYAAATRDYPRFFHFYAGRANMLQEKWLVDPGSSPDIPNRYCRPLGEKTVKSPTPTSPAGYRRNTSGRPYSKRRA